MYQFKIECNEFDENGVLMPGVSLTKYANNWEEARLICQELRGAKYDNGQKVYNVMLYTLAYKIIANQTEFFNQFIAN